jgi:hypothetical protein
LPAKLFPECVHGIAPLLNVPLHRCSSAKSERERLDAGVEELY